MSRWLWWRRNQPEWTPPKAWTKSFRELDKYSKTGKWREFRENPDIIVTIDFGTTNCSVHYLLYPKTASQKPVFLSLDGKRRNRVPNCTILKDGRVEAFGYRARLRYSQVKGQKEYVYFEHVKKYLQHDKNISRATTVRDDFGREYYLVDVIAQILHHLKTTLLRSLTAHPNHSDKKPSDIDWVITVPAIWKAAGKEMMREAAYKAGLCSNGTPDELIPVEDAIIPKEIEGGGNLSKLTIALEPECAAISCHKEEAHDNSSEHCYMLVDIGGGTVDIVCHRMSAKGYIEELCHPIGNDFGGTVVNEHFQHFLEELVKDPGLKRYLDRGTLDQKGENKANLKELLYTTFEDEKTNFGKDDKYYIRMPASFWRVYKDEIVAEVTKRNQNGDRIIAEESTLVITREKMAEFFQPAIDEISKLLLSEQLLSGPIGKAVTTIYWIGGFGSSPFLRSKLEAAIKTKCSPTRYTFCCPPEPDLAVVCGATDFRCNPGIVQKRKAAATYGVACKVPFVENAHKKDYRFYVEDRGEFWCDNIFCTFVKIGEDICTSKVYVCELEPLSNKQTTMDVVVYSSPNETVKYTTEEKVEKLAEVKVQLEGEGLRRRIQITFDAAQTEIQIRAYQLPQGKEVKLVVDYLGN